MAKWGEGDPRWIVEQRDDATNVNNWHWSEKNATQWSKDYIKKILTGLVVETEKSRCEITEVTKVEGEAVANNRKGKLIFFYELVVTADWKGQLKNSDNKTKFKGNLEVPNLSEENDPDELNVVVTCTSQSNDAYTVKEDMRKVGGIKVQECLGQYIKDLKQEYSKGLLLPTKTTASSTRLTNGDTVNVMKQQLNQPVTSTTSSTPAKMVTKKLTMKEEFFCEPPDLYKVFVERDFIQAFTRGPADVDNKDGGCFALFGGNITGQFLQLEPPSKLRMRWRRKDWPGEASSEVELKFTAIESGTKLELCQTGVPEREVDATMGGWRQHYFSPIKQTFGYGVQL